MTTSKVLRLLVWMGLLLVCLGMRVPVQAGLRQPNIVFVLADDLGYGDIGPFGQKKIRTPHLDQLAREGMRLTQHYSGNAVCAPSRCVLMTGLHPGHAFIRDNREVKPEGQLAIPAETMTLPKLLQERGYATGAFGKWGLGGPGSSGDPLRQGFDRFYGFNCQRVAHNYFPTYLWDNDRRVPLNNAEFSAHQRFPAESDPKDASQYGRYSGRDYAPDLIAAQALKFIDDKREQPFFLYFATTVPHLALQVPEDSLRDYAGQFPEEPYLGDRSYLPHQTPRAAYAAMITRLDREVGRMLSRVEELGLSTNTIVVFSSDNGPLYDRLGGTDTDFFESARQWRGRKGSLYEGGVRVPTLARWKGRIPAGAESDRVTGFEDWLPTLLDLIGAGSATPANLDGISFAPTLLGKPQAPRPFLYREFPGYGGQQSLRMGDWKAVRQNLNPRGKNAAQDRQIELYNLKDDPSETTNSAAAHPDILASMERLMRQQHRKSIEFPLPPLDNVD